MSTEVLRGNGPGGVTFVARASGVASDFFRWWVGELGGLVPRRMRQLVSPERQRLLIEETAEGAAFALLRGAERQEIGRLSHDCAASPAVHDRVGGLLDGTSRSNLDVVLRLPAEVALRRTLELPLAAEADLRQAIAFELDRQTPFKPDEVTFDCRVRSRSTGAKSLQVDLIVVPKHIVDDAVARTNDWGLSPSVVDVAGDDDPPNSHINLLPIADRPDRSGRSSLINTGLAVLVLALMAVAVALPLEQRRALSEDLQVRLADAKAGAEAARRLREEVERLTRESEFLLERKRQQPAVVEILEELSALLPDHTWLSGLEINGSDVRITGSSTAASSLVGPIEESSYFSTPRSSSPVTRDLKTGFERFNLRFEIDTERTGS